MVYVVMSNDYPDSVFRKKVDADAYCQRKMDEQKVDLKSYEGVRFYYRSYEFDVL